MRRKIYTLSEDRKNNIVTDYIENDISVNVLAREYRLSPKTIIKILRCRGVEGKTYKHTKGSSAAIIGIVRDCRGIKQDEYGGVEWKST